MSRNLSGVQGETPHDLAKKGGNQKLMDLLKPVSWHPTSDESIGLVVVVGEVDLRRPQGSLTHPNLIKLKYLAPGCHSIHVPI